MRLWGSLQIGFALESGTSDEHVNMGEEGVEGFLCFFLSSASSDTSIRLVTAS